MTREAKIGMLTGLGVIVLVGVLLSEYLGTPTASTNKPSPINNLGEDFRKTAVAPTGLPVMDKSPEHIGVVQSVVTPGMGAGSAELPRAYAADRGGNSQLLGTPVTADTPTTKPADPTLATPVIASPLVDAPQGGITPVIEPVPANGAIVDGAKPIEPAIYVQIDPSKLPTEHVAIEPVKFEKKVEAPKGIEHTIVAGDSLDKLARKYLGASTKENRAKIIAANKGILKDEKTVLVVGKKLMMPVEPKKETAVTLDLAKSTDHPVPAIEPAKKDAKVVLEGPAKKEVTTAKKDEPKVVEAKKEEPKKDNGGWYIVKKGDTLAAIAKRVSAKDPKGALNQLMKLNGIKDANAIREGQKLKLPTA